MNEDRMKKYELVEMLLDVTSWMTCCEYDESKPIDEIIEQISAAISERVAERLRDMGELPPK
jgi:hypothetical protein